MYQKGLFWHQTYDVTLERMGPFNSKYCQVNQRQKMMLNILLLFRLEQMAAHKLM